MAMCPYCGQGASEPADPAVEAARAQAFGDALGLAPEDVTPAELAKVGERVGKLWSELTPESIEALDAKTKADVRAAVAKRS